MTQTPEKRTGREILKTLSDKDFRSFGLNHIAYVKPTDMENNIQAWSIHAADGTPLSIMPTMEEAMAALRESELKAVWLH